MTIETLYRQAPPQTVARPLEELSLVSVLLDVKTDDGVVVPAGSEGTIVAIYAGGEAYEVEFDEPVVGIATVRADVLRSA